MNQRPMAQKLPHRSGKLRVHQTGNVEVDASSDGFNDKVTVD